MIYKKQRRSDSSLITHLKQTRPFEASRILRESREEESSCMIRVQTLSPTDQKEKSRVYSTLVNIFEENRGSSIGISPDRYRVVDAGGGCYQISGLLKEEIEKAQDNLTQLFSIQGYNLPSITSWS